MHIVLTPLINIAVIVLDLYVWALILSAVISWLVAFNVVNTRNHLTYLVSDFLYRITEPALCSIRRLVPRVGGIDLSPMVLILSIMFLKMILQQVAQQIGLTLD